MTLAVQPADAPRYDVRTMVGGGIKLGVLTAVGVTSFALLSRLLPVGSVETVVQSSLVLLGGAAFSYLPAAWVRPREVDTIAWTALLGLLGAVAFTVIDTIVLRSLSLYHWKWDAIGGGSGFWYIPVWWIGSAVLAWLGGWVTAIRAAAGAVNLTATAGHTVAGGIVVFAILTATELAPFHSAVMALAYAVALVLHVPLVALRRRR